MESKLTSPSPLVQPKTICGFAAALVLLGAASFPFTQRSSKAAETSGVIADQAIAVDASRLAMSDALIAREHTIVRGAALIDEVAGKIPSSLILAKLTDALPNGTTLLDFSFDSREPAVRIRIGVLLLDGEQTPRLVEALRKQSLFANVAVAGSHDNDDHRVELEMTLVSPSGSLLANSGQSSIATGAPASPANQRSAAEISARSERAERDIAILESVLPMQSKADQLMTQVIRLATTNSLQLTSIKPLPSRELAGCVNQPLALTASGNFNGFYSFLLQLESLPRLKSVSRMEIHGSDEHNGDVQAALTLDVFCASQQNTALCPKAQ